MSCIASLMLKDVQAGSGKSSGDDDESDVEESTCCTGVTTGEYSIGDGKSDSSSTCGAALGRGTGADGVV
eukprot:2663243-Amphidinium_carterae.1